MRLTGYVAVEFSVYGSNQRFMQASHSTVFTCVYVFMVKGNCADHWPAAFSNSFTLTLMLLECRHVVIPILPLLFVAWRRW